MVESSWGPHNHIPLTTNTNTINTPHNHIPLLTNTTPTSPHNHIPLLTNITINTPHNHIPHLTNTTTTTPHNPIPLLPQPPLHTTPSLTSPSPTPPLHLQGFRGSKIPVRCVNKASCVGGGGGGGGGGLRPEIPVGMSRSQSLRKLSDPDPSYHHHHHQQHHRHHHPQPQAPQKPHSRSLFSSPEPFPLVVHHARNKLHSPGCHNKVHQHHHHQRKTKPSRGTTCSSPSFLSSSPSFLSSSPSFLSSSSSSSSSSSCPRLDCTEEADPYQTPAYFTFHLTLRSHPYNDLTQHPSTAKGHIRCGDASNETEEQQTKENEPEGRGRRLGDIQESEEGGGGGVSEEGDGGGVSEEEDGGVSEKGDGGGVSEEGGGGESEEEVEMVVTQGTQHSPLTEDDNNNNNNTTDHQQQEFLCHNNFGIVDYLNAVMKEGDQEDGDSHCGDYGTSLGVSPPGRFSDTESLIEPMAVSSDFPLNKQQQFTPTFTDYRRRRRKIEELKSVRWRSCQELTLPRWLPGVLKRQTSDEAIKVLQRKQSSFRTLVKVYDGNLGVSVLSVSDPMRGSTPSSSSSPRVTEDRKYLNHNNMSKPSCILESESVAQPSLIHGSSQSPRRRTNHSSVNQSEKKGDDGPVEAEETTTNPAENKRAKLLSTTSSPQQQQQRQQQQYQLFSSVSPSQKSYSGHLLATSDNQNTRLQRRRYCKERPQQDFKVSEANDIKVKHKGESRQSPLYTTTTSSSPHQQLLWNLTTKDSHHRINNESSVHQIHPRLSDTGKTASKAVLIAPPDYRLRSSDRERSGKQRRVYSGTSTGGGTSCSDGEDEESDTGMELSDLERCVLNLSHRRSQLRRQDTNAFLIAPPEFKITDSSSSTFHSPKGFLR
ncbi:hypothetical protein Pmani_025476 [Petrolisthes manimaculis]|uniref:Uncharacterized protein n=1 Tax=Petrolisthes manimaculis TaxID=1843537 RepID=A0AAE1P858_9EUCA|nr:hypothetical protein Pmani_025476 [Petrolisthes manimaculis]